MLSFIRFHKRSLISILLTAVFCWLVPAEMLLPAAYAEEGSRAVALVTFDISGAGCLKCSREVEHLLRQSPGVVLARVARAPGEFRPRATVIVDTSVTTTAAITAAVNKAGYEVVHLVREDQPCSDHVLTGWANEIFWSPELSSDPNPKLETSRRYLQSGNIKMCISSLRKIAGQSAADLNLACALLLSGELGEAGDICRQVLESQPKSYAALRMLGQIDYDQTKYAKALLSGVQLVDKHAQETGAYKFLADCYERVSAQPADYLKLVLQSDKDLHDAKFLLLMGQRCLARARMLRGAGATRKQIRGQWYQVAEESLGKSLALAPANVTCRLELVRALWYQGKDQQALDQWKLAVKQDPQQAKTLEKAMLRIQNSGSRPVLTSGIGSSSDGSGSSSSGIGSCWHNWISAIGLAHK